MVQSFDDQKLKKKIQLKKFIFKDVQDTEEACSPQKRTASTLKNET
jgi:hypothetical protein